MNAVDLYPHLRLDDHEQLVAEPPRIENLQHTSDELLWQTAIEWVAQYHNHIKKIAGGILRKGQIEFDDLIHDASLRAFEILKSLVVKGSIEGFVPHFFATFRYDCMIRAKEIAPIAPGEEIDWGQIEDQESIHFWTLRDKVDEWIHVDEALEAAMDTMSMAQKTVISLVTGFHVPRKTKNEIASELSVPIDSPVVTHLTVGFRAPVMTASEVAKELGTSTQNVYQLIDWAFKSVRKAQNKGMLVIQ